MKCCFSLLWRLTNSVHHCVILCENHAQFPFSTFCFPMDQCLSELVPHCFFLCSSVEPVAIQGWLPWHRGMGAQTWCFFHTFTCSLDFLLFLYLLHDSRVNICLSVGEALCIICLSLQFKEDNSRRKGCLWPVQLVLDSENGFGTLAVVRACGI